MKSQVSIQGLRGSFHHEAANHFFGEEVELKECETFPDVIQAVEEEEVSHGLMAIENSLAGSIIPNYLLLRNHHVEIVGEVGLRVRLNVMALPGTRESDIDEVHSHQMAIRQCGSFFSDYPSIKIVESFDTAGSAKRIKEENLNNVAAIASQQAASEYNLEIIKPSIEDHELNYTRFLVLQKKGMAKVSDPNKVSIYFQTKNDPGSLAKVLSIISGLGINLGKLQSHPVPSKNSLYGFYATLVITELDQLEDLKRLMIRMTIQFEILGVYKQGETHG